MYNDTMQTAYVGSLVTILILHVMPRAKNGSLTKIGVVWQKLDFWAKTEILGPKKGTHFFTLTMFWPRPEKVVQRKKVPLPK